MFNNEATNEDYLHTPQYQPGTGTPPVSWVKAQRSAWTEEMVRKSQNAHGVSLVEIARNGSGEWEVVRGTYNRRITANTPMTMSGPATRHRLVRTSADPLGTINNCAHGFTPWGTYLTCEENFNGYFLLEPGPSRTPSTSAMASAVTATTGPPTTTGSS